MQQLLHKLIKNCILELVATRLQPWLQLRTEHQVHNIKRVLKNKIQTKNTKNERFFLKYNR
jgi:hypothetical protein